MPRAERLTHHLACVHLISRPAARWLTAILSSGLLVGCSDNSQRAVVSVESVQEANEIIVALADSGIPATLDKVSTQQESHYDVKTAASDEVSARRTLVKNNLPRERNAGFAALSGGMSLIPTATEEKARLMNAIAGELERTLETYDGVIAARVHVVLEDKPIFSSTQQTAQKATATALIKYREGAKPVDEAKIKLLISGAVPGLSDTAVQVFSTTSGPQTANAGDKEADTRVNDLTAANADLQTQLSAARRWTNLTIAIGSVLTIGALCAAFYNGKRKN